MNYNVFSAILGIFVVAQLIVLCYLIVQLIRSREKVNLIEKRYHDLELKANNLQLESLESKLNPHLFKNVLNSIQSHAYQTYYALDKLGNVLDYILYESRRKFVTPKEEVDFAQCFIEINKIKLSPLFELRIKTQIGQTEPLYDQELLAPLVSVDLIENAFKHTNILDPEAFISITFAFRNNQFYLSVSNKISGKTPLSKTHAGFGLNALEHRLRIIYGNGFTLEKYIREDVHHATLKINLLEHKNKMFTS